MGFEEVEQSGDTGGAVLSHGLGEQPVTALATRTRLTGYGIALISDVHPHGIDPFVLCWGLPAPFVLVLLPNAGRHPALPTITIAAGVPIPRRLSFFINWLHRIRPRRRWGSAPHEVVGDFGRN